MFSSVKKALSIFSFFLSLGVCSQPANDNCANPTVIPIPLNGYALGTFVSANSDLSSATTENGETFYGTISSAGQTAKSIWYQFTLPTARKCTLKLKQPTPLINNNGAGFTVYLANSCFPNSQDANSALLASQPFFGGTSNPCLKAGTYMVQVSANANANGPIYIELEISSPNPAAYDNSNNAYNIGVLGSDTNCERHIDISLGCYSTESLDETCPSLGSNYTQSAWATFTTDNYHDFIRIALSSVQTSNNLVLGYRLYEGDVHSTSPSALTLIDGCLKDTLNKFGNEYSNTTNNAFHNYRCAGGLQPNTTYSIQVIAHKDATNNIRITVEKIGTQPASSTQPLSTAIAASNQLGILPAGQTASSDYFGCNSLMSQNPCGNANPATGVFVPFLNTTYDLSLWYTFELSSPSIVRIDANFIEGLNLAPPPYIRIFEADVNTSCSTLDPSNNLMYHGVDYIDVVCMPAGKYSVQILGESKKDLGWCRRANYLGNQINLVIDALPVPEINHYSLATSGAVDTLLRTGNTFGDIQPNTLYTSHTDTFGCANTVLPTGNHCDNRATKAVYTEFEVGDGDGNGVPDSGFVDFMFNPSWDYGHSWNILYRGDAMSLADAQNAHAFPGSITGLVPVTPCVANQACYNNKACVVPGIYTMVNYGDITMVGDNIRTSYTLNLLRTIHYSAALAEDMGSILDTVAVYGDSTVRSQSDTFSCLDNPETIGGLAPCEGTQYNQILGRYELRTKLIYRQFYLSDPSYLTILTTSATDSFCQKEVFTLFFGKATDGIAGLSPVGSPWICTKQATSPPCSPLPVGWYTIVTYGQGPSYENPTANHLNGGDLGISNQITISVEQAPPGPQYNRPETAAIDTLTGQPFLLETGNRGTTNYPITDTLYSLYKEYFDCTTDTPFYLHPLHACDSVNRVRVAYYVFTLTQEAYLHFRDIPSNIICQVYQGNARTTPAIFNATPIQPCVNGGRNIQMCRVQPGTYTLVLLVPESYNGDNISPSVYIDEIGYSRFDHAALAYDFDLIPPDSVWYNGQVGDVHPTNPNLAPSNDFFYCTTGARTSDPIASGLCDQEVNPNIYNVPQTNNYLYENENNFNPRRNLWYSFVLEGQGYCRVKVRGLTPNKYNVHFKVYKSNVDGTLPFSIVQSTGQVDSSLAQGLTQVATSYIGPFCYQDNSEVLFYSQSCKERYYVIVDQKQGNNEPIQQIDVSVLWDTIEAINLQGDFCSDAVTDTLNGAGSVTLSASISCHTIGEAFGEDGYNMSCLIPDSGNIDDYQSTWYRFDITSTDTFDITPVLNNLSSAELNSIRYRLMYGNCSAMNTGSCFVNANTVNTFSCLTGGTYYIQVVAPKYNSSEQLATGEIEMTMNAVPSPASCIPVPSCFALSNFIPSSSCNTDTILFINQSTAGDSIRYLWNLGYNNITDTIKNPTFVYPASANSQTYTVTLYTTNLICNQTDSITKIITVYKKPKLNLGNDTTICEASPLTLNAGTHEGTTYLWQNGSTDSLFTVTNAGTYSVQSNFNNCIVYDSINVSIIPLPLLSLGDSIVVCSENRYLYDASQENATYLWNTGSTSPIIDTSGTGTYSLTVTANGCSKADTVTIININDLQLSLGNDTSVCTSGIFVLNAVAPNVSSYLWNNGSSNSTLIINSSGTYWVDITMGNCTLRDSISITLFPIDSTFEHRISCNAADTGVVVLNLQNQFGCDSTHIITTALPRYDSISISGALSYCAGENTTLTANGGISYLWNDSANSSTQSITAIAGVYTVTITDENGCTATTSAVVIENPAVEILNATTIDVSCNGWNDGKINSTATGGTAPLSYIWEPTLPDRSTQNNLYAGTYSLTVTDNNSCSVTASYTINEPPLGVASIHPSDTTIQLEEQITLTSNFSPFSANSINSYQWSPSEGLSCDDCPNPVVSSFHANNQYTLTITYNDVCEATATATVLVIGEGSVYIPNAFTPNGDGKNDVFEIFGKNIYAVQLKIFNRWGEKVYDNMGGSFPQWNGKFKGVMQPPMVYVYDAEITFLNGTGKHVHGSVTLIL